MANKGKNKARPVSGKVADKYVDLVNAAQATGYNIATGFRTAVAALKVCKASKVALEAYGARYCVGYVAASLFSLPAYAERWGNMTDEQRGKEAQTIIDRKPPKTEEKPDGKRVSLPDAQQPDGHRLDIEHKAVRAAQTSLSTAKRNAGIEPTKAGGRAPRPSSTEPKLNGAAAPVDLVKAAPKFDKDYAAEHDCETPRDAANDYFRTAAAALLTTVNRNVGKGKTNPIDPKVSTAVADFHAAIMAAIA